MDEQNEGNQEFSIPSTITYLMAVAQSSKGHASTDVEARRWAVFYTELEKTLAYYQAMLEPKRAETGGSL